MGGRSSRSDVKIPEDATCNAACVQKIVAEEIDRIPVLSYEEDIQRHITEYYDPKFIELTDKLNDLERIINTIPSYEKQFNNIQSNQLGLYNYINKDIAPKLYKDNPWVGEASVWKDIPPSDKSYIPTIFQ